MTRITPLAFAFAVFAQGCYQGLAGREPTADVVGDRNAQTQLGRLTSVGTDAYREWFDYDELGRVVQQWWAFDDRIYASSTTHGYPTRSAADGELGTIEVSRALPHRLGIAGESVEYRHDRTGVLRGMTAVRPDGRAEPLVASISTNARGQVTQTVLGTCGANDCSGNAGRTVTTTRYDETTLRMSSVLTERDDAVLRSYGYTFDANGDTLEVADHRDAAGEPCRGGDSGCGDSDFSTRYDHDSLGRVARTTSGGVAMQFAYDASGNLVRKAVPGDTTTHVQSFGGSGRGPHAIAEADGARYEYDGNGNLARTIGRKAGDVTLTYNAENVAVASTTAGGGHRKHVVGTTTWKKVEGDTTTYYLPNVRIETTGETDEVFHHYGAVAERDPAGSLHFHVRDHLGNTALVLDRKGEPERRLAYWTWGEPREDLGDDADYDPRLRFGNKETDLDTGFIDFGPRLYMPDVGRFASPDPTVADGPNRYAYVRNNPARYADPSGYAAQDPVDDATIRIETRCVEDEACLAGLVRDGAISLERRSGPTVGDIFNRRNALETLGAYDTADKYWGVVAEGAGRSGRFLDNVSFRRNPYVVTGNGRVQIWEPLFGPLKLRGPAGYAVQFAPTFSPRTYRAGQTLLNVGKFGGKALPIVGGAVDVVLAYGVISDPNATNRSKTIALYSATYEIGLGFVPVVGFAAPFIAPTLAEGTVQLADDRARVVKNLVPGDAPGDRELRLHLIGVMGSVP